MDNAIAKFIRLKSGDDLVAEAFETGDDSGDYITVINPLKAIYVPSTVTAYLQIAFMPWVYPRICDIQEFNIKREEVLIYQDVTDKMNEYYWENLEQYLSNKRDYTEDKQEEEPVSEETLQEMIDLLKQGKVFH